MRRYVVTALMALMVGIVAGVGPAEAADDPVEPAPPTDESSVLPLGPDDPLAPETAVSASAEPEPSDSTSSGTRGGRLEWSFEPGVVELDVVVGEAVARVVTFGPQLVVAADQTSPPALRLARRGHDVSFAHVTDAGAWEAVAAVGVGHSPCHVATVDARCEVTVRLVGRAPGEIAGALVATGPGGEEIARIDTDLVVRDADDSSPDGRVGSSQEETDDAGSTVPASSGEPPAWLLPLLVVLGAVGAGALARVAGRDAPDTTRVTWNLRAGDPHAVVVGHDGPLVVVHARLRRTGHESIG
jgi:hypothetical protein